MKKLKKRRTARTVAVLVVVLGTILGMNLSVSRAGKAVEAQFYDGVYLADKNYTEASIDSQLTKSAKAAAQLVTAANNYGEVKAEREALNKAKNELLGAKTIAEKSYANSILCDRYAALLSKLETKALDGQETAILESSTAAFEGAQGVIARSAYNAQVHEFTQDDLGRFPINLLKVLIFVGMPDQF